MSWPCIALPSTPIQHIHRNIMCRGPTRSMTRLWLNSTYHLTLKVSSHNSNLNCHLFFISLRFLSDSHYFWELRKPRWPKNSLYKFSLCWSTVHMLVGAGARCSSTGQPSLLSSLVNLSILQSILICIGHQTSSSAFERIKRTSNLKWKITKIYSVACAGSVATLNIEETDVSF